MKLKNKNTNNEVLTAVELTDDVLDNVTGGLDLMNVLTRSIKEKVVNAANDTNTDADRRAIQKEIDQIIAQIDEDAY